MASLLLLLQFRKDSHENGFCTGRINNKTVSKFHLEMMPHPHTHTHTHTHTHNTHTLVARPQYFFQICKKLIITKVG